MICPRETDDCPVAQRIRGIELYLAETIARGATFSAEMPFTESCKRCGQTKSWKRLSDGSIRTTNLSPVNV